MTTTDSTTIPALKGADERKVRKPIPLCERCAEVRWRTGTLPGSLGGTNPARVGRHVKLARSCWDCGTQAYRVYAEAHASATKEPMA